jgi:hypothetical protein
MSVGYGWRFIFHYTQITPFGTDSKLVATDYPAWNSVPEMAPQYRKPWRLYGCVCIATGVLLGGLNSLFFMSIYIFQMLSGLAIFTGLVLLALGTLDRFVVSKGLPSPPQPRLVHTAWSLFGTGIALMMIPTCQTAVLEARRSAQGGYSNAIEQVLVEDSKTSANVRSVAEVVARMRSINLSGCPGDFSAAYMAHVHAWELLASVEQEALSYNANFNSGEAFVEAFIRGALGDPFGKMNESIGALNDLKQSYQRALAQIKFTYDKIEEIATKYGASVPQRRSALPPPSDRSRAGVVAEAVVGNSEAYIPLQVGTKWV